MADPIRDLENFSAGGTPTRTSSSTPAWATGLPRKAALVTTRTRQPTRGRASARSLNSPRRRQFRRTDKSGPLVSAASASIIADAVAAV